MGMNTSIPRRQPAGTPTGGQFAATARPPALVRLGADDEPLRLHLLEVTDAEVGAGREEFTRCLPNLSPETTGAAWASIEYINQRQLAAWDHEDIEPDSDEAAVLADDRAREAADEVGADAWDDEYGMRLREFYIDELQGYKGLLCRQLAAAQEGHSTSHYEPVAAHLPVVRFWGTAGPMAA